MSITIQLDLPESVAAEAKAKGLLDPQNLTRLIEREVKAEAARRDFFDMVRELRSLPGEQTPDTTPASVSGRTSREHRRIGQGATR